MKTKTNKIIKGIKILSKGKALYYAVFVSAGSGCEKKNTPIQSAKNLICTQDSRGSNKTKQTLDTAKNHGPISTINQPNQRNVKPGSQKNGCDSNKVTDPDSKFKDGRLDNVEKKDSIQQNSKQKSPNLEPPIQSIPVNQNILLERQENIEKKDSMQQNSEQKSPNLEPPIQSIPVEQMVKTLKKQMDKLQKLKKEKLSKIKDEQDIKAIEDFCEKNTMENIRNVIKNKHKSKETIEEGIQIILKMANSYIAKFEGL